MPALRQHRALKEQNEMTPEERFERIERDLAAAAANIAILAEATEAYARVNNESMKALAGSVSALVETVAAHVESSNARMDQLDATLKAFLNSMRRTNGHG
jgi:hypothetical protein